VKKITQNLFSAGRSVKNVPRHLRQFNQAKIISYFQLQLLPKVSKTIGIPANTQKNIFLVKDFTQGSEFANFREIKRAKT
jgi:hypothetical protein